MYFNSGLSGKTVVMIIQDLRVQGAEERPRDEWEKQIRRRGDGEIKDKKSACNTNLGEGSRVIGSVRRKK